jgi:hypothetical protein
MSRTHGFGVGETVALTSHAVKSGLQGRACSLYGRIVRVQKNGYLRVQREGIKFPQRYSASWWRHLTPGEAAARGSR